MIRIRRLVVGGRVTGCAILRSAGKHVVHVTLIAGNGDVSAGQREFCRRIVIECGALPSRHGVTGLAISWKIRRHMIGIFRIIEFRAMAAQTVLRQ